MTPRKRLEKECEELWRKILLIKADYKSELSGIAGKQTDKNGAVLDVHHIARKPNYRLRYELENGIVLTKWEHRYGIHGNHEEEYRKAIKRVKGKDIYERMALLRNQTTHDLRMVKTYLEKKLKEVEEFEDA